MESKGNDLKIDLYPDKKPRYEFDLESISDIIPKNALGYSLDTKKKLGYIKTNVPVLYGFNAAHNNHYPIRIKPDDIWLLIVQSFSNHVNTNSEELRNMFVDFQGKKELIVKYGISTIDEVDKKILENFSEQINEQMKEFLGEKLLDILTPNYSTTTYENLITCKISIMGAFKKYFDYTMHLCGCGVPYIILEGTADDYKKIIEKAKYLSKYKFEWYINRIIPHIEKMVAAKEGNIDKEYFQNMIQRKEETEYISGPSGIGGHEEKFDYIAGWFLSFFAYIGYGDGNLEKFDYKDLKLKIENFKKLPSQMLTVPFKIIDINRKEYNMIYKVGFVGCDKNEKFEISPVTGWIVSPEEKEDYPDDDDDL